MVVGSGAGGGTVAARLAEAGQQGAAAGGRRRSRGCSAGGVARHAATPTACRTTTTCRPSTPSPRRTRRCAGTSSSATTPTTDAAARPEIPERVRRPAGRRRALPARRHARRLHRAQCDDPGLPAQCRLGRHRRAAPATRPGRPTACSGYFRRLERCRHRPIQRALSRARHRPHRPWLGRLAADREGDARRRTARPAAARADRRLRPRRRSLRAAAPLQRLRWFLAERRRSQRPRPRRARRRGRALHAAHHPRPPPHRHARAAARRAAARYPDRLRIELDALATRVLLDESNRAVGVEYLQGRSGSTARMPSPSAARGRAAAGRMPRARSSSPAAPSTRRSS